LRYIIALLAPAQGQNGGSLIAEVGKVLTKACTINAGWDGRLMFVYLPYLPRFFAPDAPSVKAAPVRKNKILTLAKKIGVTAIDLEPAFDVYASPGGLAYAPSKYYSEAGSIWPPTPSLKR
jgi:hypothetical protein